MQNKAKRWRPAKSVKVDPTSTTRGRSQSFVGHILKDRYKNRYEKFFTAFIVRSNHEVKPPLLKGKNKTVNGVIYK